MFKRVAYRLGMFSRIKNSLPGNRHIMSMQTMSFPRLQFSAVGLMLVLLLSGCGLRETLVARAQANREAQRIAEMKTAAESGNASAQNQYGEYFGNEKHDDVTAHAWYLKSAQAGDAAGEENLARDYIDGRGGVAKNDALAASWMQKSADQGRAHAEAELARMYAEGRGVPKNKAKQIALLQKAALQWDPMATHDLIAMGDPGGVAALMLNKGDSLLRARDARVNDFQNEQRQQAIQNSQPAPQQMCVVSEGSISYERPCP